MRRARSKLTNVIEVTLIVIYIIAVITFAIYFFAINRHDSPGGSNDINVSNGNLEVDIIDPADGSSLVDSILPFVKNGEVSSLYFEPGATCITIPFRVKNIGTLPLDYNVSISEGDPETAEEFKKAFSFGITTDPAGARGIEALPSHRGVLKPGESSEDLYIFVTMRESAGNEYQGKSYKGIGITVNAVELEGGQEE